MVHSARRLSAIIILSLALAGASLLTPGAVYGPVTTAHALGCYDNGLWLRTDYHAASYDDYLGQNASTDITAWHDGCGHKQARVSIWSSTGSYLTGDSNGDYPTLVLRQWTCGHQDFGRAQYVSHSGGVIWSGWYNESGCGDQWDNAFVGPYSTVLCTSVSCHDAGIFWPSKPYLSIPCNKYNC